MPVCSYIMHMYMCTYLSVYTWLADLCIYYICIGEKRHCYGTGVFEYDVSLNLSMCLAEDRRSISASLRSYHQGKSWPMTAHVIEWEKAGWEGTCKINYSSPSSANEEQEAQSSWVILVKIPELDLGKVIRLCSFCSQECPPGVTVGVCRALSPPLTPFLGGPPFCPPSFWPTSAHRAPFPGVPSFPGPSALSCVCPGVPNRGWPLIPGFSLPPSEVGSTVHSLLISPPLPFPPSTSHQPASLYNSTL